MRKVKPHLEKKYAAVYKEYKRLVAITVPGTNTLMYREVAIYAMIGDKFFMDPEWVSRVIGKMTLKESEIKFPDDETASNDTKA